MLMATTGARWSGATITRSPLSRVRCEKPMVGRSLGGAECWGVSVTVGHCCIIRLVGNRATPPLLPRGQLLAISVYWFGINALWGGYEIFGQWKVQELVGIETRGQTIGLVEFLAALVAIVVQPTVGSISDYLQSRWGRRKPFIFIGGLLDVVAIFGLATSQTLLALTAFLLMLSFTSNFAQGPFQGYVPDLVPDRQVNNASALVGLMRLMGVIVGAAIVSTGAATGDYGGPLIVIGLIEAALAIVTVLTVREGPAAKPRDGKSWSRIAREAWGMDALRERSFVFMTLTRLMFLAGPSIFVNLSLYLHGRVDGAERLHPPDVADAWDLDDRRRNGRRHAQLSVGGTAPRPEDRRLGGGGDLCRRHRVHSPSSRAHTRPLRVSSCSGSARAHTSPSTGRS